MEKLSLAGLAEKLEVLTEEVSGLRQENAGLRRKVAELTGTAEDSVADALAPDPPPIFEGAMSRRSLFTKAGAAAVVAIAAGMMLTPREAQAETFTEKVKVLTREGGGDNLTFLGYRGAAVTGNHKTRDGVWGLTSSTSYAGVHGDNNSSGSCGVYGRGRTGVQGRSTRDGGYGVYGSGDTGVGGITTRKGFSGVFGLYNGSSSGYGVRGETRDGAGVVGRSGFGYGGEFSGARAQLKLQASTLSGRPTRGAHKKGEIYMDVNANLFVCYASGTPGSWVGVATYTPGGD